MSEPDAATAREDPFDARRAQRATGVLREFNQLGLLAAADVHVAQRLATLAGEPREAVALAFAFAVRAPRLGHVFVDLASISATAGAESEQPLDASAAPWPAPEAWIAELADSELVAVGEQGPCRGSPLRLLGSRLYLDRYWQEERRVAADLRRLVGGGPVEVSVDALGAGVGRLFADGDADPRQRLAAAAGVLARFAVIAGGPGTGKTTTVARIVALLAEQSAALGARLPLVALAAPTGKAAARLQEAVHEQALTLPVDEQVRALLRGLLGVTLHRLLGGRPQSHSRFAHDRDHRLPHDVVIVDETSMVSLSLMARLVEAVRSDARLILVGDPGQLASIEAGVVLADIVGPAAEQLRIGARVRAQLARATGSEVPAVDPPAGAGIGDGIVVLARVHRYGVGIARLAEAIRGGDPAAAIDALHSAPDEITWLALDADRVAAEAALEPLRSAALRAGRAVIEAARAGAAGDALAALSEFRLLCAHRRGPHGAATWTARQQLWLAHDLGDLDLEQRDYVGRPLLMTENDYELGLYNGDTGVIVWTADEGARAVFERGGRPLAFSPLRLASVETVLAMTIHKSQGSQFDTAAVLLGPSSPILTRELLYTAVTRARRRLILVAPEDALLAAITRPIARASGLRRRLWGDD
ncbi:MAG: exodeoxyribonuclease V subunit alpha [Solirubrobacteraceae bacterium]